MKKILSISIITMILLMSGAWAQQCLSFVRVNDRPIEGQSACYFSNEGDNQNAFMRATDLASALGTQLVFDASRRVLVFSRGRDVVELQTTSDIPNALIRRAGILSLNGQALESQMAIVLSTGITYVPVSTLANAFNGRMVWEAASRTIIIYTAQQDYVAGLASSSPSSLAAPNTNMALATTVQSATAQSATAQSVATQSATATTLPLNSPNTFNNPNTVFVPSPRIGIHSNFTRVAIDFPMALNYRVAVSETMMIISFPGVNAGAFSYNNANDPFVSSARYEVINGVLSLIVNTRHLLSSTGQGYDIAILTPNASTDKHVLYVDFGPTMVSDIVGDGDMAGDMARATPNTTATATTEQSQTQSQAQNSPTQASLPITSTGATTTSAFLNNPVAASPVVSTPSITTTATTLANTSLSTPNVLAPLTPSTANTSTTTASEPYVAPLPPPPTLPNLTALRENTVATTPVATTSMAVPTASPTVSANAPKRTVILDPGHGGVDPGAQGYISEEVLVLNIALETKAILEQQGINVILTRSSDESLANDKRNDLAARTALATRDRNLFVSIHANAAASDAAKGIETWIFGEPVDSALIDAAIDENGGGALGEALTREAQNFYQGVVNDIVREEQLRLSKRLADIVQNDLIRYTGARDRGVRENYFYVIRNAQIPAILIEVGFVTHPEEGPNLASEEYQKTVAQALAYGIINFFSQAGAL